MRERLKAFAKQYDGEIDRLAIANDEQRSIHHPLIFVFLGDLSLEALGEIYAHNTRKWNNSSGVFYFHLYSEKSLSLDQLYSVKLELPETDRKTSRPAIRQRFYADEKKRMEINSVIRQISSRFAERCQIYASFQRLTMAVVTRIDDPMNILLPEITLMMKTVFSKSFKSVHPDFYGLISEKHDGGDIGLSSSLGISFLRELDDCQRRDFRFHALLEMTDDAIKLPVTHENSPLFDLAYLLSDKVEDGTFPVDGMSVNYEIISNLNVLKNQLNTEGQPRADAGYNNSTFKKNISLHAGDGNVYCSAGFARIKRPNQAIALTVLHQLFRNVVEALQGQGNHDRRSALDLFGLDAASIERIMKALFPDRKIIEDMKALMINRDVSWDILKRLTLRETEHELYGEDAACFFNGVIAQTLAGRWESTQVQPFIPELIKNVIIPQVGLYSAFKWTSDSYLIREIRNQIRETAKRLEETRATLDQLYNEKVERQWIGRFVLLNQTYVKRLRNVLLDNIYGQKYEIAYLETRLKLLRMIELKLETVNQELGYKVEELRRMDNVMEDECRESMPGINDYNGRNIPEYYRCVVKNILTDLESRRGPQFYLEDRYLGDVYALLEPGSGKLLNRLIDFCKRYLFTDDLFQQPFEQELLQRANVTVNFEHGQRVLPKEELYRDLVHTLEKNSAIHLEIYNYTFKRRYEETYFFGDRESEFIKFAFSIDVHNRTCHWGCMNVKKTSGIEKLDIMGGFRIEDMMFYRNGKKYYDHYISNGFQFHSADTMINHAQS